MSRRNITGLPFPTGQYRIDKHWPAFGNLAQSVGEAGHRVRRLRTALLSDSASTIRAIELARLLDPDDPNWRNPENPANPVYMRDQRIRIVGGIWKVIAENPDNDVFSFTLIPEGTVYAAGCLYEADPIAMNRKLRTHLRQAGIKDASGFLFMGMHGEFDPATGKFRLHWHGIGVGRDMRHALDRLRKVRAFKSRRASPTGSKVDKPIRVSRAPLGSLPAAISYTVQGFWPSRWTGVGELGQPIKQRNKHRIKEPHHSEHLLWLSKWQLQDLILMVGMRATKHGLKIRN